MDMGSKIQKLRLEKGLTLEQLGDKVGVGKSTVRKWENGMIANMRRDKIAKIADALEVSPAYLMGWEESPAAGSSGRYDLSDEAMAIARAYDAAAEYKKSAVADLLGVKKDGTTGAAQVYSA